MGNIIRTYVCSYVHMSIHIFLFLLVTLRKIHVITLMRFVKRIGMVYLEGSNYRSLQPEYWQVGSRCQAPGCMWQARTYAAAVCSYTEAAAAMPVPPHPQNHTTHGRE